MKTLSFALTFRHLENKQKWLCGKNKDGKELFLFASYIYFLFFLLRFSAAREKNQNKTKPKIPTTNYVFRWHQS